MPGPWKPWKTKLRFPPVPTAPWKSPKTRFPHSHSTDDGSYIFRLQTTLAPFRRLPSKARIKRKEPFAAARPVSRRPSTFGLIPRWNQSPVSGSSLDWKMLDGRVGRYGSSPNGAGRSERIFRRTHASPHEGGPGPRHVDCPEFVRRG